MLRGPTPMVVTVGRSSRHRTHPWVLLQSAAETVVRELREPRMPLILIAVCTGVVGLLGTALTGSVGMSFGVGAVVGIAWVVIGGMIDG